MDTIRLCIIGDNMGMLAYSPSTYPLFFPFSSTTKRKSENPPNNKAAKTSKVTQTQDATSPPTRSRSYLNNSCAENNLSPYTR